MTKLYRPTIISKPRIALAVILGAGSMVMSLPSMAAETMQLLDTADPALRDRVKPSVEQVTATVSPAGIAVAVVPGPASYPGISIRPPGEFWDLSAYGHIVVKLTNTSEAEMALNARIDNPGSWRMEPWNTGRLGFSPGQTRELKIIFGYNGARRAHNLDASKVNKVLVFTDKVKEGLGFRVDAVWVGGTPGEKPPVKPEHVRTKPTDSFIMGGAGLSLDPAKQVWRRDGGTASVHEQGGEQALHVALPAGAGTHLFVLKPTVGAWDLGHSTEARVKLTNAGTVPFTPRVRLGSGTRDLTAWVAGDTLEPGGSSELVVPYVPERSWIGPTGDLSKASVRRDSHGTGTDFSSHATRMVHFEIEHPGGAEVFVDAVRATVSAEPLPSWVGTRPPVDGSWTLTLDEPFDGSTVNTNIWSVHGPNWWGVKKLTHWSRDNVIVSNGMAHMRFEKKLGHHNDNPENRQSPYAGGFLESYGKWTQLYGYFEARMKLPVATALWPAFWTMPDRGGEGERWVRGTTRDGGMEFDIMEHLTSWGPYRYTTALHWDDYGKDHKATGARVYFHPDPEGFVTSGVLWLPGLMVYYCQGREVARWENERICNVPMNMIFTMPVGGWENEKHPVDAELPVDFVIDYVRVWQRADLLKETESDDNP